MAAARIILGRDHGKAIRSAALAAFPLECCGLLVGDANDAGGDVVRVHTLVPASNTAPDPARHFEIDPQILFDHMRSAREIKPGRKFFEFPAWFNSLFGRVAARPRAGTRIVGHYHSHPNGRGEPSAEDRRRAYDPDAVWVIAGVEEGAVSLRAFVPAAEGFTEIPVEI